MPDAVENFMERLGGDFSSFLPSLIGALLVLVGGWLVALLISRGVEKLLLRTSLDDRLYAWFSGDSEDRHGRSGKVERFAAQTVFYGLMVFVLIGFFQVLGLTAVTEPLDGLLDSVMVFLPRIGAAALLALLAWAVATGLRVVVKKGLGAAGVDRRLAESTDSGTGDEETLSTSLSEVVYWAVWLLFLPAILSTLELRGLLGPVQGMVDKFVNYLPNIVLAGVILLVGWFVARIVQRVVTNLLAATGFDSFASKVGVGRALGSRNASDVVGIVLYTFILIPIIISALQALDADAITEPASAMLETILATLPALFGAALVLVISYVIGKVVADLVANLLESVGVDRIPSMLGLESEAEGGVKLSGVARWVIMTGILLFASVEAAGMLGFEQLSGIITEFIAFASQILVGLIIFGLGIWLSQLAERAVRATAKGDDAFLASAARIAVLVMAGAMALRQMGLANEIVVLAFAFTFGSLAVAFAIAFGVGGREVAGDELKQWVARRKSNKSGN